MREQKKILLGLKRFFGSLGPGLITGASDDDPSAITTYSQAGAQFGLATLWFSFIAFPILAILQEMCARIGIVTGKGLTAIVKQSYPTWVLYLLVALSCPAFLLNIGADIEVLGEAGHLIIPGISPIHCSLVFTIILFILIYWLPYKKLAAVMKFICLILLVYLFVPFLSKQSLSLILKQSLTPSLLLNKEYLLILTGITGAIISPYLFFWQISSEVELLKVSGQKGLVGKRKRFLMMRMDILAGAFFAVLIMYFIILTSGTILHSNHLYRIDTIRDAALALEPLAGKLSYLLFAVGILGTATLIIPVLSATISYIVSETFNLPSGLSKKPKDAGLFYIIIAVALILGLGLNWMGISAVKALLLTTLIYGMTCPLIILLILHIANNKKIMGEYTNNKISNIFGVGTLLLMFCTLLFLTYFLLR